MPELRCCNSPFSLYFCLSHPPMHLSFFRSLQLLPCLSGKWSRRPLSDTSTTDASDADAESIRVCARSVRRKTVLTSEHPAERIPMQTNSQVH